MNTKLLNTIRDNKGYTKKYLCEQIGMTPNGYDHATKNNTLKVRDLESIADVLEVPVTIFFDKNGNQNFFNRGDNSPISIGSSVSQKGTFGNENQVESDFDQKLLFEKNKGLEKEIEGLKAQLGLKDEIIEILKTK